MGKKIALVTGGNRGLGLETCRQLAQQGHKVFLTSRDKEKGAATAATLQKQGLDVTFMELDVDDSHAIDRVKKAIPHLDILVNNAGVAFDLEDKGDLQTTRDTLIKTFDTNTAGAFLLCQAFLPLMQKQGYGRIVNVSSGAGQLQGMETNYPAYRLSKTAMNAVTAIFAARCGEADILVNSVCPGWVKTDMGGEEAPRTVQEGAKGIVWAALLEKDGPNGGFFRDQKPLPW